MLRTVQLLAPKGASTLGFDAEAFPPDAASLLPGLLAATRTGLAPAGDDELVIVRSAQTHHLQLLGARNGAVYEFSIFVAERRAWDACGY